MWWDHVGKPGADRTMAREEGIYLGLYHRWRELPKPTIAMVQGACMAGALPLVWACDLIVASDDAFFAEPLLAMGVPGVEVFKHPWELGPRQAEEIFVTGEPIGAERARGLGMVDIRAAGGLTRADRRPRRKDRRDAQVQPRPREEGSERCRGRDEFAPPPFDSAFALHQLAHVQNELETGSRTKSKKVGDVRKVVEGEKPERPWPAPPRASPAASRRT